MDSAKDRKKVLDLLVRHEELIGALYETYAAKVPEMAEFWTGIAREEEAHARWIRKIDTLIERGKVTFDSSRFNVAVLKASLEFVEAKLAEARGEEVVPSRAFAIGHSLENGLIEKDFFKVFTGDSPQFQEVLNKLAEATKEHGKRMQKAKDAYDNHGEAAA